MQQAKSLRDLMSIRAYKENKEYLESINGNLGTAVGFKKRTGEQISNEPAIIVFIPEKVNPKWLSKTDLIRSKLEGPGDLWCPLDVVEGQIADPSQLEPVKRGEDELCERLRGWDDQIWVGSQISRWYNPVDPLEEGPISGTIGAFAKSRDKKLIGILTNQHVAHYIGTYLYHPVVSGKHLAITDRFKMYETPKKWYGLLDEEENAFVRTDCAFAPIKKGFDMANLNIEMMGVGKLGTPQSITLNDMFPIGQKVLRVGRTTGLRRGTIAAFSYEYNDGRDISVYTDLLIAGDEIPFSTYGDSGSLIVMDNKDKNPIGLLWGGWQSKLRTGFGQEKWSYGICLDRVLDSLKIDLITDPRNF
jgi:hypothetical protein